ncbi:hypothetical protein GCM10010464_62960 [Pseudonocardia yunnanensis]
MPAPPPESVPAIVITLGGVTPTVGSPMCRPPYAGITRTGSCGRRRQPPSQPARCELPCYPDRNLESLWCARDHGMAGGPTRFGADMPLQGEFEISPVDWVRDMTNKIIENGTTDGQTIQDRAVVLVTVRGAKTGKLRKVPLMRVENDGQYAIVASLGGAPKNPVWYYNVKGDPHVDLQDGTVTKDYTAREVFGDEKAEWWERSVAAYPPYADYQKKTDRQIPVFVLDPITD